MSDTQNIFKPIVPHLKKTFPDIMLTEWGVGEHT